MLPVSKQMIASRNDKAKLDEFFPRVLTLLRRYTGNVAPEKIERWAKLFAARAAIPPTGWKQIAIDRKTLETTARDLRRLAMSLQRAQNIFADYDDNTLKEAFADIYPRTLNEKAALLMACIEPKGRRGRPEDERRAALHRLSALLFYELTGERPSFNKWPESRRTNFERFLAELSNTIGGETLNVEMACRSFSDNDGERNNLELFF
jgi:hypothetical protein